MEEKRKTPDATGQMSLSGSVERIIFANEENGYTICDVSTEDGDIVTVVGTMPLVGQGDFISVRGNYINNPKYGRQFSVKEYERRLPADVSSILRYLSSGAIKGIGPKTAQRIVDEFGEDTFDILENNPELLARIKGISRKAAERISEEFERQSGMREAMLFFRDFFGATLTLKIYNKWGKRAVDVAKRNPYRLCGEIEGIGFEKADRMAEKLGFVGDNPERLMSGILYVLADNANMNGHVCLPRSKLIACGAEILGVIPEKTDAAISGLIRSEGLKYMLIDGEQLIYEPAAYYAERYIAEKLSEIDRACPIVEMEDIDLLIEREEKRNGIEYAGMQRKAITDALRSGVMILTGGPGTGKTTVVRALLHIFESMGFRIALAAPTGRAAKRLSESTSREAKTIHRLLEMGYADGGGKQTFARDENNMLEEDVIIIDEASMVDNMLMYALLKAVKPGAKFIFIGDADQLPSVGAGNVLKDLIICGRFATVELTEIFRQAQQSLIVTNAHAINKGIMPELYVKDRDFFFISRQSDREIAATVADLYKNRLPKTYGEEIKRGLQVIAPSRRGEAGTQNLNILLQRAINPPAYGKRELKYKDIIFREGDRVMQTRNNYEIMWTHKDDGRDGIGLFNGDIGIIEEICPDEMYMRVDFDSRLADIEFSLLDDLEHAYAVTVHKSQGSEYPVVIIPVGSAPEMLLTRNLLYTAITRAQNMVILVGVEEKIKKMVSNNRQSMRYTGLYKLLAAGEIQNEYI